MDGLAEARERLAVLAELPADQVEDDAPLLGVVFRVESRHLPGGLELEPLVGEQRRVTAVVDDQRRPASIGPLDRFARAPPVLVERFALPGEDGRSLRALGRAPVLGTADDDRRGCVVLGREDVAGDPANVGSEVDERLDEHGRLNGHVEAAHDPFAGEGLIGAVSGAKRHQSGHFLLGEADLLAAGFGEGEIGDLERRAGSHGGGNDLRIQDGAHASPWTARTGLRRASLSALGNTRHSSARMPRERARLRSVPTKRIPCQSPPEGSSPTGSGLDFLFCRGRDQLHCPESPVVQTSGPSFSGSGFKAKIDNQDLTPPLNRTTRRTAATTSRTSSRVIPGQRGSDMRLSVVRVAWGRPSFGSPSGCFSK